MKTKKKVVMTYGTFDLFHYGHLKLLNRCKGLGEYLIVGVSTDEFNKKKGKLSVFPFEHRKAIVEQIKYVDLVIPEYSWEQKVEDIKKFKVDILVMGDDWEGQFDYLKDLCEVIYLPRTPVISSSLFKSILTIITNISKEDFLKLYDILSEIKKTLKY